MTLVPTPIRLSFDRGTLLLAGLAKADLPELPVGQPWSWDHRVGRWRCDALHYPLLRRAMREAWPDRFVDEVGPFQRVAWPQSALPKLREEQEKALQAWRDAGGRGMVVMPTGTGKTEVALAAMAGTGISTLVVAPVRDLMHQWHQRILRGLGYDAGIVGDSLFNVRPVTVTTYDSAYLHMADLGNRFGLVIFDEAHHLPGRCYRESALMCAAPGRLGLTATPHRSDGLETDLDWLIGPLAYEQAIGKAKGKSLADYQVVRIPVKLEPSEQESFDAAGRLLRAFLIARREEIKGYSWEDLCAESGKDPQARQAQRAFHARKAIEDRAAEKLRILEDLFRLHSGQRVIVFAGSNAMARQVSRRFLVPTLLSHSRKKERREVLEGFASGAFPVLVANRVLDEGVDVPEAKVAIVIGGQASPRQAKQRLGRILRKSGNLAATLYEVVVEETGDVERSRSRRRSDAYGAAKRWRAHD